MKFEDVTSKDSSVSRGLSEPLPIDKVVGSKRLKSGRAKFSKVERVDNF